MKVLIIGAGLGGLLSAAKLVKEGHSIEMFERLPDIGGRFRNINYKGYKLSTGALHMIPHGRDGPLATMLTELDAKVTIVNSNPFVSVRVPLNKNDVNYKNGFKDVSFNGFMRRLSIIKQLKIIWIKLITKINPPITGSFYDWITNNIYDESLIKISNSFCGWALSLKSDAVPTKEIFEIFKNIYNFKGPGVPIGGCTAVIDSLSEIILSNGGKIHTNAEIKNIVFSNGNAKGVVVNGIEYLGDVVISNIGHSETFDLYCNENINTNLDYFNEIKNIKPSAGVKICISSNEPLIGHGGVLLTPFAQRINGINEVTNIDPTLAPDGKHLAISHQCVQWKDLGNIKKEINIGLEDLKYIFKDRDFEILLIQSYHNGWPVNRSASGTDITNKTPIDNLYIVGDGAKGKGGIEVEGVALGVRNVMDELLNQSNVK